MMLTRYVLFAGIIFSSQYLFNYSFGDSPIVVRVHPIETSKQNNEIIYDNTYI